jgi:peptidyl-prolyl cis-trans isomerase D
VEVAPSTLMAGRIVEYLPAKPRTFEEVEQEIRRQLVRKAASDRALSAGREKLALLEKGKSDREAGVTFSPVVSLGRNDARPGYSPEALKQIFRIDPAKVPQYAGTTNERGGFSIYKVEKVIDPPAPEAGTLASASTRIGEQVSREMLNAYLATLKAKADVKINQANLEKK